LVYLEHIFVALIGGVFLLATTITTAFLGFWGAKKLKIGPNQEKLVDTLNDLLKAQEIRIQQLEQKTRDQQARIKELEDKVKELQMIIIDQARELERLHAISDCE
jgi:TolA-binding protein